MKNIYFLDYFEKFVVIRRIDQVLKGIELVERHLLITQV